MSFSYKGFNLASYWNGMFSSVHGVSALDRIVQDGANSIAITSTAYIASLSSDTILATAQTERLASVAQALDDARERGLQVVLKPHLDPLDGQWRGRLNPSDPAEFFKNYKAFMLDHAKLAQDYGVKMLTLGVEMDQLAGSAHRAYWADLISAVRDVYKGELTYAANWDSAGKVAIWDLVDVIGVNPYVPLTASTDPTYEQLVRGWIDVPSDKYLAKLFNNLSPVEFYKSLSEGYNKPLVMTEIGYTSTDGANMRPMDYGYRTVADQAEQAMLYQAFFDVWGEQSSWMKGAFFWGTTVIDHAPEQHKDWAKGYTIDGKLAETVVKQAFQASNSPLIEGAGGPPVTITIRAAGDVWGRGAEMVVVGDGQKLATVEVTSDWRKGEWQDFTVTGTFGLNGLNSLRLFYTNDAKGTEPGEDRNLYIDHVLINGVKLEAETVGSLPQKAGATFVPLWSNGVVTFTKDVLPATASPSPVREEISHKTPFFLEGTKAIDILKGGSANDTIIAGYGDYVLAGAGNDLIIVKGKATILHGGDGEDVLRVECNIVVSPETLSSIERIEVAGGVKADFSKAGGAIQAFALAGGAQITGTAFMDTLTGGTGHDILEGGAGDILRGGAGNDVFYLDNAPILLDGGSGTDTVFLKGTFDFAPASVTGIENFRLEDGADIDFSALTSPVRAQAAGSGGITLIGTSGTDALTGSSGNDRIEGGDGNDVITGLGGEDILIGGAGDDRITQGSGNSFLDGGAGNDWLFGSAGADTLSGGSGNDNLNAGTGDDTFVFDFTLDHSAQRDVIHAFGDRTGNNDTLVLKGISLSDFTLTNGRGGVTLCVTHEDGARHDIWVWGMSARSLADDILLV
jgi:Ca2+-binding RTX toxin-like protein